MSTQTKTILQEVFILATGRAANAGDLLWLESLTGPQGDNYAGLIEQVDSYMNSLTPTYGVLGLIKIIAKNGLGIVLTDEQANAQVNDFLAHGIDTWGKVFEFCVKLATSDGMVLNNRASASQSFVDNLDASAKGGFFTGVGVGSAVTSLLQNIGASATSLSNGQAGFSTLASKLTAAGITAAVVDGYVRGATVFVDANGDGILNNGEFSTVTDASGNFVLPNSTAGGKIIAFGGTDLLTGKAFQGVLTAPAGSTQVNPVTTLVQALLAGGQAATVEAATATVQKALSLPTGVNLLTYDALAVLASSTASTADKAVALGVQASAQQLANIITQGAAAIKAGSASTLQGAADAVISALVSALSAAAASPAGTLDLASTTALTGIMQTAASSAGATTLAGQAGQLAQVTAASNAAAAEATTITELAKAAVVAQGSATDALVAGASSGSLSNAVSGFTGSALNAAVSNATPAEITAGVPVTPTTGGGDTSPSATVTYSLSTFAEAAANDGSITAKLTLTLSGGTFTGTNGQPLAGAVVTNVPAGLTAVVTKLSATTAELSFSGRATNHFNSHDIGNLSLTLGNTAFTGGNAGNITGSSKSNLVLDFADPVLTYSGGTLAEAVANDGSVTAKLTMTLSGDTFTGTNGQTLAGAIVTNVPAGLTAVVTKISATTAQLSFTGNATSHANAQDISNLAVTLGNAAFTGGTAAAVTGAVKSGLNINFADTPVLTYSAGKLKESTPSNDGSITTKLTLALSGDTFTGADGQALAGATVTNVPAGLTAVVTRISATTAELSFTGSATAHAHAQDISNLTVTLGDAAFTSAYAAAVTGATRSDLVIDFADPDGGNISDGYISGATVFADANGDGILNNGEAWTTTDSQGNFKLDSGGHGIVSFGGTDISTGLVHTGVLKAPAGSTVINPLTTLVAAIAAAGGSVAEAQAQVVAKLGLAAGTDLSNFDPLVQATRTGATTEEVANAVAVQKAAAQVANIMVQTASTIVGQAAGTNAASNATEAAKAIASLIAASSTSIDLTNTTTLQTVLTTAAGNAPGVTDVQKAAITTAATAVASVMSASNAAVSNAAGTNTIDTLTNMAKAQVVAQGSAATALQTNVADAVTEYTDTALTAKVAAATALIVTVNAAPTIDRLPQGGQAHRVNVGQSAALNDFTVTDIDGDNLTVTLTATNGTVGGLTDADTNTAGIQLTGTAESINTALAAATFTATAARAASITISVADGKVTAPVSGTYQLIANGLPTGAPTISGTVTENQILTAVTSSIGDGNGVGTFSYQWLRDGAVISGATASTYALGDVDVAKNISLQVSYTDGDGTTEKLTSVQTASVLNVNDAPTGAPTISGTVTEDQTLTAVTSGISDADGLGVLSYQWLREGSVIAGATASSYSLNDADVGKKISVKVSYTDAYDSVETLTTAQTANVVNLNDLPAGVPAISGMATRNQTLTAVTDGISDDDGLGNLGYQWLRDGTVISGATASTYILGGTDVAKNMSVRVSYTDGHGTVETLMSAQTAAVANGSEMLQVGAGQEYATIQSAIDASFAGDTILVAAGTYTGNVTVNKTGVTLKTTAGAEIKGVVRLVANNITIDGFKLDGTGQTANIRGLQIVSGDGITVANMDVSHFTTGASLDFAIVEADHAATGVTGSPRNIKFTGNSFTGNTAAIGSTENVPGLHIGGNTFTGNEEDVGLGLGATLVGNSGSVTIQTLLASNTFDSAVIRDYRESGGPLTHVSGDFIGLPSADRIIGFAGNDRLTGGAGDDVIDGGAGTDVAAFSGDRGAYVISAATLADRTGNLTAKTLTVVGPDGSDTFTGVETLDFATGTDVSLTGAVSVFRGLVFKNSYATIEAASAAAAAGDTIISASGGIVTLPESRATLHGSAIDSDGDLYAGDGNTVTGFQIARAPELGLELALKAKIPFGGGDGTGSGNIYQVPSGLRTNTTNRSNWNIDFSIAADTDNNDSDGMLGAYNFKFLIDIDPGEATQFAEINPLAQGNDNNFHGGVINPNSVGKDVAQNSFNYGFAQAFFTAQPADFYAAGRFDIKLQALDKTSGAVVLENSIVVIAKNTITGTAGNDNLTGTAADDVISGAAADDVITGGDGSDILTGGTGADIFAYTTASQSLTSVDTASGLLATLDHITDFTPGIDKISLAKVLENGMRSVGTHFVDLGASQASIGAASDLKDAMTLAAAALHAGGPKGVGSFHFGGNTYVLAQDGDAALSGGDIAIRLDNLLTLTAADFLTLATTQASRATLDASAIDPVGGDMYAGNGIAVTGFQIARADDIGLELAIKGRNRDGSTTGTGDQFQVLGGTMGTGSSLRAKWNIDFSIAADTDHNNVASVLSAYDFKFLIDTDRSAATRFVEVDALTYAMDHNFYAPPGGGGSILNPASVGKDVVQNSFNFAFADFQVLFDDAATTTVVETYNYGAAQFDMKLQAVDRTSGKVVLEDAIVVKVGSSFSATVSGNAVSFGGTASGTITMSLADSTATFSRGGETAVVENFTGKSVSLASTQQLLLTAEQINAQRVDIATGGRLIVDVVFTAPSGGDGLLPVTDISKVFASGVNNPATVWDAVDVVGGDIAAKFKLFWVSGDKQYYSGVTGGTVTVNKANVEITNEYATYLRQGGPSIDDIVQTKVGGIPNASVRLQSLHDNVLANAIDSVIASRFTGMPDPRNADAIFFGTRPYYDGNAQTAGAVSVARLQEVTAWDIANDIRQYGEINSTLMAGQLLTFRDADNNVATGLSLASTIHHASVQAAIDTIPGGGTLVAGSGTHVEAVNVVTTGRSGALELLGAHAGVIATATSRGTHETIVDAGSGIYAIRAEGALSGAVTIDGFTVETGTQGGIAQFMSASAGTFHVLNNIVNASEVSFSAHGNAIQISGANSTVIGNKVEIVDYTTSISDWSTSAITVVKDASGATISGNFVILDGSVDAGNSVLGIGLDGHWTADGTGVLNGISVAGNHVSGVTAGISLADAVNAMVTGNTLTDNSRGIGFGSTTATWVDAFVVTVSGNIFSGNTKAIAFDDFDGGGTVTIAGNTFNQKTGAIWFNSEAAAHYTAANVTIDVAQFSTGAGVLADQVIYSGLAVGHVSNVVDDNTFEATRGPETATVTWNSGALSGLTITLTGINGYSDAELYGLFGVVP